MNDSPATTGALGTGAYLNFLVLLCAWRALALPGARATAAALGAGLLALFINMKFNPVALEVLAPAAVPCAALSALGEPPEQPAGRKAAWPATAALVFASASAALAGRLLWADRQLKAAQAELAGGRPQDGAARLERAIALNPCENSYKIELVNGLGDRINATRDVAERLRLLALGTAAAEEALRCHARDVNSHYLAGTAALMKAQLGFSAELAAAAGHYDAARLAGDLPAQARLRERIRRLEALERR